MQLLLQLVLPLQPPSLPSLLALPPRSSRPLLAPLASSEALEAALSNSLAVAASSAAFKAAASAAARRPHHLLPSPAQPPRQPLPLRRHCASLAAFSSAASAASFAAAASAAASASLAATAAATAAPLWRLPPSLCRRSRPGRSRAFCCSLSFSHCRRCLFLCDFGSCFVFFHHLVVSEAAAAAASSAATFALDASSKVASPFLLRCHFRSSMRRSQASSYWRQPIKSHHLQHSKDQLPFVPALHESVRGRGF